MSWVTQRVGGGAGTQFRRSGSGLQGRAGGRSWQRDQSQKVRRGFVQRSKLRDQFGGSAQPGNEASPPASGLRLSTAAENRKGGPSAWGPNAQALPRLSRVTLGESLPLSEPGAPSYESAAASLRLLLVMPPRGRSSSLPGGLGSQIWREHDPQQAQGGPGEATVTASSCTQWVLRDRAMSSANAPPGSAKALLTGGHEVRECSRQHHL